MATNEHIIRVPGRIKNSAVYGHVAGAEDIFDDAKLKNQATINAENDIALADRYTKNETYSKEQLNNLITTPEQVYITLVAEEGDTLADIFDGVDGAADTIYRVANWDGEQYDTTVHSEYAWDGENFVFLDVKNPGVTDTIEDSDNLIKSSAVAKYLDSAKDGTSVNGMVKFALTDRYGNVICYLDSEDKFRMAFDLIAGSITTDKINDVSAARKVSDDLYKLVMVDNNDNVIFGIDKNDNVVSGLLDLSSLKRVDNNEDTSGKNSEVYKRNIDKEAVVINDAYGSENVSGVFKKRFQAVVTTDTHLNNVEVNNWVNLGEAFKSVDCLVHLGDMTNYLTPGDDNDSYWNSTVAGLKKPTYIAIGNHDVGTNASVVNKCREHDDLYNQFVLPLVNKGFITSGEYTDGKCYYYHDFATYKVRLVVLYPFETDLSFDTEYWIPVEYDETAPFIKARKQYNADDVVNIEGYVKYSFKAAKSVMPYRMSEYMYLDLNSFTSDKWVLVTYDNTKNYAIGGTTYYPDDIVNVRGYTDYSLKCKTQTTLAKLSEDAGSSRGSLLYPRYKANRYSMWFSKEQLDWLCATLDEAGSMGYTTVIACHYNVLGNAASGDYRQVTDYRFNNSFKTDNYPPYTRLGVPSLISDIVNAYQKGGHIDVTVNPIRRTDSHVILYNGAYYSDTGAEGYVPPVGTDKYIDDISTTNSIETSYDFSNSGNVVFICGHSHSDGVLQSTKEEYEQTCIAFLAGVVENKSNKDIVRDIDDSKNMDALTVFTLDNLGKGSQEGSQTNRLIHLTRIGADVTRRIGSDNRLIKKDNEIINY